MAIKFLDAIDLTGLELNNVRAQNNPGVPATALGEGQFLFDSTAKTLKYWNGTAWIELDGTGDITGVTAGSGLSGGGTSGAVILSVDYAGADNVILEGQDLSGTAISTGFKIPFSDSSSDVSFGNVSDLPFSNNSGSVTSVGQTHAGNAFTVGGSPITSSGTLAITMAGAATQYINGLGNLITFPTLTTGTVTSVTSSDTTFIAASGTSPITSTGDLSFDLSASGTPSATNYLRGDNTWASITAGFSGFSIDGDNTSPQSISNGATVSIFGGKGISTVSQATDTITVNFDACSLSVYEDVVVDSNFLVGCSGESGTAKVEIKNIPFSLFAAATSDIDMGGFQVSNIATTPSAATDAASKSYVDTTFAGSGALIFQGGYDATTAAPTGAAIKKGFTYAVTVAGTGSPAGFWSPTLEVGDLIIAEQDDPTSAANWTEINKNIDVATDVIQGIANFPTAGGLSVSAGAVSLASSGVTAGAKGSASKSATVTVDAKGIVTALTDQDISISASQITSFCTEVESCVAAREYTEVIGGTTSMEVTHSLGTLNVMVQVYENSGAYKNVEVSIGRKNTNTVNISTAVASTENSLVCLISKIGA